MFLGKSDMQMEKMKSGPCFTVYTKIDSRYIVNLILKTNNKPSGRSDRTSTWHRSRKKLSYRIQRALTLKKNIDKSDYITFKNSVDQRQYLRSVITEWGGGGELPQI